MLRNSEKLRFKVYFNRFIDPKVSFRQKWVAGWRYIGMLENLALEKIHGTDYVMIHNPEVDIEHCGAYTMSPKKVLKRIFNDLGDVENLGFIDVGSGKGFAIKMAYKAGFKIVGGVEYNEELYGICKQNLTKDRVPLDYVKLCKAQEYDQYGLFDVFYFNNPFDEVVLAEVAQKIKETHSDKKCYIYYLNPNHLKGNDVVLDAGFNLKKIIEDKSESYFTMNVYEN